MPFASRRQQRAAFGGHIPGFSREQAKEWAAETDFSKLPDRAPAEKGKPTLRSKTSSGVGKAVFVAKKLREQLINSGTGKNVFDAVHGERERSKRKKHAGDEFVDFCAKIAFAVPRPGQISMTPRHVGSFPGQATTNFLKAPGSTTAAVTNPRLSLRNAMTKTTRT